MALKSFKTFLDEGWKSSWTHAGNDPSVKATGEKFKQRAKWTAHSLGVGAAAGVMLGAPGGLESMKVTVPAMTAFGAAAAVAHGGVGGMIHQGTKYLLKRSAKTAVARIKGK